jgi:uncharacterized membrane protein
MNQFLVVIFPDEKKAYEGLRALKELDAQATLTLYSNAVIGRDGEGWLRVKERQMDGPLGAGVGALVGGLVGLLAGPAGAAIGLGAGGGLGALRDLFNLGVSDDFLQSISRELAPGKAAIVAEVEEEWVSPLDARMESLGGLVIREWRDDFVDEQLARWIGERKAELAQRRAELAAAREEKIFAMKMSVGKAEERLRVVAENAAARVRRYGEESEAKIRLLQEQAKKAGADAKSRIDGRIAEIRADQKQRLAKLEQARKLTQEALRP